MYFLVLYKNKQSSKKKKETPSHPWCILAKLETSESGIHIHLYTKNWYFTVLIYRIKELSRWCETLPSTPCYLK